jgi:glycosyltransferase involved in cell wall biosynthesis
VVVCVARFDPDKRHDVLLRALAATRDRGHAFRCDLVGEGPSLVASRELCTELGLEGQVRFLGAIDRDDVLERLSDADVFALVSMYEGMPGSILEAMAAGLPVVGTDVNGIRELVADGVTGRLVAAGDVEQTAVALAELLADAALRAQMGRAGRACAAERYDFARVVTAKAAMYRGVSKAS